MLTRPKHKRYVIINLVENFFTVADFISCMKKYSSRNFAEPFNKVGTYGQVGDYLILLYQYVDLFTSENIKNSSVVHIKCV